MMVRNIGAQIGLLAFAVALVAGLYAGNTATVVLLRAVVALVVGAIVGQAAGWAAKMVLRDHLQHKKLEIDRQHFAALGIVTEADTGANAAEPPAKVGAEEVR